MHLNMLPVPCRVCSRVVMPQPDALQLSEGKVCGQYKHVHPPSLKHWLFRVCEVVGLTFPFCAQKSYCNLMQIYTCPHKYVHKCHQRV